MTVDGARLESLALRHAQASAEVQRLLGLAPRGLAAGYCADRGAFAQTVRAVRHGNRVVVRPEGTNLRYAAIAALGLARVHVDVQREVLAGGTARELAASVAQQAMTDADPGAVALATWAAAEICGDVPGGLVRRQVEWLTSGVALTTVDVSWMLTAATVGHELRDAGQVIDLAAKRLLDEQRSHGIYPHVLPPGSQARWRAHVGSFADQVYPLQALARAHVVTGDRTMLEAANATAGRICELQGAAGQWWWHYDIRDGNVVEAYPVYAVHQHAMAPMVLHDLVEAGGDDHRASVDAGVTWLVDHPEVLEDLVSERHGLVWRKVGRREPPKAARAISAVTTSVRPALTVPGLSRLLPPVRVDHECRPYELGWLLYAWLPRGGVDA